MNIRTVMTLLSLRVLFSVFEGNKLLVSFSGWGYLGLHLLSPLGIFCQADGSSVSGWWCLHHQNTLSCAYYFSKNYLFSGIRFSSSSSCTIFTPLHIPVYWQFISTCSTLWWFSLPIRTAACLCPKEQSPCFKRRPAPEDLSPGSTPHPLVQ